MRFRPASMTRPWPECMGTEAWNFVGHLESLPDSPSVGGQRHAQRGCHRPGLHPARPQILRRTRGHVAGIPDRRFGWIPPEPGNVLNAITWSCGSPGTKGVDICSSIRVHPWLQGVGATDAHGWKEMKNEVRWDGLAKGSWPRSRRSHSRQRFSGSCLQVHLAWAKSTT